MNLGFWEKLPKPFFALAPMFDVTDAAFRRIVAKYGKPDVMFTEFVSADGLCSRGREKLLPMLGFTEAERPIVAQIFSANPEKIREAASLVRELGFDGVDLNMGCPDRKVMKQGAGAALIKDPKRAREIVRAAKEGVRDEIPVSVKTRSGDTSDTLTAWLPELLAEEPAAVTIHARTRKDMSKVPARWELIRTAVAIRDRLGSTASIVGNGDVASVADGEERARETGADGVMVGRGIFGNPWFFRRPEYHPSREERLRVVAEHAALFEKLFVNPVEGSRSRVKSFDIMRKHIKAYVSGWEGAAELRAKLMTARDAGEVERIISGR